MENHEKLIAKVIAGEASAEERAQLEKLLGGSSAKAQKYRLLYADLKDIQLTDHYSNRDRVFERIMTRVSNEHDEKAQRDIRHYKTMQPWMKKTMAYAASLIIILSVWYGVYQWNTSTTKGGTQVISNLTTKQTAAGQKTRIFLPDRSVVWLNAESSISYPEDFSDTAREVYLTGEAYFEVEKDQERPFRVQAKELTITALGTAFNVRAHENEGLIQVALAEGKVSVEGKEYFDHLEPGEAIAADKVNASPGKIRFTKYDINIANTTAWKDGVLVFESQKLSRVFETLERWYGVRIHLEGQGDLDLLYSGKFVAESLDNVLESMRFSYAFDYSIDAKDVHVHFK